MGDVFVSAMVQVMFERLTSEFMEQYRLVGGLKDDILTIKNIWEQIEAVIQEEEKKVHREVEVDSWLKSARSVAFMIEDVLDEITTEAMLQALNKNKGIKYRVRAFFSTNHNRLMFHHRIAHKVNDIRRKLDVIASKRSPSKGSELSLTSSGARRHLDTGTTSDFRDCIVGRASEMNMVIDTIFNKDKGRHDRYEIRVYGIWGMGGLGKTTLARLVYNDERVVRYFDYTCWISVSVNFQVKEIIQEIIASIDKRECTLTHLDELLESLRNKLRRKKFLITLDDVWIEYNEKDKWDLLSETLSIGAEESIVMMTTRSMVTCQMMAKVPELQHNLGGLSEEESWLLFKKLAFEEVRVGNDTSELEPIGREIVEKCKGLPLAVKNVGELMRQKRTKSEWQDVKDNIWELEGNKVLECLKLSYHNLLPNLRQCFAYCCLFPKGYDMEKDVMIKLWDVNGFIPPRREIDLYQHGEEIYNCLVWRSFFQVVKDKKYSKDRYKMHDLMHDMARHVMRDDCLLIESASEEVRMHEALHLSSSYPNIHFPPDNLEKTTSLRSIFMFGEGYECNIKQIANHVLLRVLYLCGIGLRTLPESICKLKHLRYLNLSYSSIEVLPESIVYLQNLQMLLLNFCYELCKLPEDLRHMSGLRFLEISSCHSLRHLPSGIKKLTGLQVLSLFPVHNKCGAKISELGDLNHLKGELEISGLENVSDFGEARSANLKSKINLSVLELSWSETYMRESKGGMHAYHEEVLEGLEPNPSLKELKISFYMGRIISPGWMINLMNLVEIGFFGCRELKQIPPLGRLPKLRVIKLLGIDSLKSFHDDDTNKLGDTTNVFLSLEELDIFICPKLVSLPSNFPKLEVLKLEGCGALVSLPDEIQSFKGMKELEISGCKLLTKRLEKEKGEDWSKISHIPNIRIDSPDSFED